MRRFLEGWLQLALRIFFRRIDWLGAERIPTDGPVIFCLNHPNGLIDPLLLLIHSPRQVCFLAKSTLFKMPIVGWGTRALDSIPVYRAQDDPTAMDRNQDTFVAARRVLEAGKAIAIFPEGVSHNEPRVRPLKTGAARIALGCKAPSLRIVPGSVVYSEKRTFRSRALVLLGDPIPVTPPPAGDEASRLAIRQLTDELKAALDRAYVEAHQRLAEAEGEGRGRDRRIRTVRSALFLVFIFPAALLGILTHYGVYRLVGWLSLRLSQNEDDMVATFKVIGSMLFFPLNWALWAGLAGWLTGSWALGLIALAFLPTLGFTALGWVELLAAGEFGR